MKAESNANVENWFRFIKKDMLNYKLYQKPGRIIAKIDHYVNAKMIEKELQIPSHPTPKGVMSFIGEDQNEKDPQEFWNKKSKTSKNYFDDKRQGKLYN